MDIIATVYCAIGVLVTLIFYLWKFKRKKFIFLSFNISVFIMIFSTLVMPFYFTFDQAWLALGISSADSMSEYLSHSILINVTGYLIFIMTAFLVELQNKNVHFRVNLSETFDKNICPSVLVFLFWITTLAWIVIVLVFNHGIPLLNGGRTFYITMIFATLKM